MTYLHAIVLGIVEGITEFLPVSSTGHLILAGHILGLQPTEFLKTFEVVIQLGAIFAIVFLYRNIIFRNWRLMSRVLVAFIPTGIIGLLFYRILHTYFLGNEYIVVGALFVGGIVLIAFEKWYLPKIVKQRTHLTLHEMSYKDAALIGFAQAFALIPGVSRSGATIVGGMTLGLSRKQVVEFSFLLAVPTMLAASGLDLLKADPFSAGEYGLLAAGFLVAFAVAIISVKFLLKHMERGTFEAYGLYRILVAVVFFLAFLH